MAVCPDLFLAECNKALWDTFSLNYHQSRPVQNQRLQLRVYFYINISLSLSGVQFIIVLQVTGLCVLLSHTSAHNQLSRNSDSMTSDRKWTQRSHVTDRKKPWCSTARCQRHLATTLLASLYVITCGSSSICQQHQTSVFNQ